MLFSTCCELSEMGGQQSTTGHATFDREDREIPDGGNIHINGSLLQRLNNFPQADASLPRGSAAAVVNDASHGTSEHLDSLLEAAKAEGYRKGTEEASVNKDFELQAIRDDVIHKLIQQLEERENQYEKMIPAAADRIISAHSLPKSKKPMCRKQRRATLLCYQENPNTPLNCSDEVRAFSTCAHKVREEYFKTT